MARKKRRSYGSGCVLKKGDGLAIRWREPVLLSDGSIQRVLRYEALGPVSQREATQTLRDRQAACQIPKRVPKTFEEFAKSWKAKVLPMYKYSTRKHHAHILEKKLVPFFGDTRIDRINTEQVQQFIAEHNAKRYSPNSIDHYHNVLSTVLSSAVKWGYISRNPATGAELPKLVGVKPKIALTPEEAQALISALAPMPKTLVAIAILTGVRRGELFALRWKCFDAVKGMLSVQEAIYENVIDKPKTQKSIRDIPLSQSAIRVLLEWRESAPRRAADDFIFARHDGGAKDHKQIMRDHVAPACRMLAHCVSCDLILEG
jgi:integrase